MPIKWDRGHGSMEMELRAASVEDRTIVGVVAPYDETTYLVRDPAGERICRGAFTRWIEHQRSAKKPKTVFLTVGHDSERVVGRAVEWRDNADGLVGTFEIKRGPAGDEVLEDARDGWYGGLSVEFVPVDRKPAPDKVIEVREAALYGVALVKIPAYESAVLCRQAQQILESIAPRPTVDLSPIPAVWLYDRAR